MELRSGTYLQGDKYRIERTLGRGGFGVTYLAVQGLMDRNVCIKEFFPKGFYNRESDTLNLTLASQSNAATMEQYKQKFRKRCCNKHRIKTIQNATVTGNQAAIIFNARLALNSRHAQVTVYTSQRTNDAHKHSKTHRNQWASQ